MQQFVLILIKLIIKMSFCDIQPEWFTILFV